MWLSLARCFLMGAISAPRDMRQCGKTMSFATTTVAAGISWITARDAAQHPSTQDSAHDEGLWGPNASSVKVDKPCLAQYPD